jgi:hypothetical protein
MSQPTEQAGLRDPLEGNKKVDGSLGAKGDDRSRTPLLSVSRFVESSRLYVGPLSSETRLLRNELPV